GPWESLTPDAAGGRGTLHVDERAKRRTHAYRQASPAAEHGYRSSHSVSLRVALPVHGVSAPVRGLGVDAAHALVSVSSAWWSPAWRYVVLAGPPAGACWSTAAANPQ